MYKLSYYDRYCSVQCNGTLTIEADSLESARIIARDWLIANGGIEGLNWSVNALVSAPKTTKHKEKTEAEIDWMLHSR